MQEKADLKMIGQRLKTCRDCGRKATPNLASHFIAKGTREDVIRQKARACVCKWGEGGMQEQ